MICTYVLNDNFAYIIYSCIHISGACRSLCETVWAWLPPVRISVSFCGHSLPVTRPWWSFRVKILFLTGVTGQ